MARPRLSDRADYGLVYLMPIDAFHKSRISLEQLGEVVHGYGDALEAYRAGTFDPAGIGVPSVYAIDPEAWRKHLECFIDGIDKTEKARAKKRGEGVSLSVSPSITSNRSKDEGKMKEKKDEKKGREGGENPIPPSLFQKELNAVEDFERFWNAYGRRGSRLKALQAFKKAVTAPRWPGLDAVIDIVKRWRNTEQWREGGGKYQPHAATWLKREGWDEELPAQADVQADAPSVSTLDKFELPKVSFRRGA